MPPASPCSRTSARRRVLGRDPVGEPLGELPAALDVTTHPMGDYQLVVLRHADPRALRAVLDNTPAAIFLKDPEGRYLLVNRAFETLHGKPAAEIVGRLDRDVLPPDISERMRVDDLRVMSDRRPIELQEEVRHERHDADVPVGQVPADRRRRRRALRRRRRRHRHHPPQPPGGAPARGAAAGGGRAARGRRRARLQQPARGDRQLRAVRAQGAGRGLAPGRRHGPDHHRVAAGERAHAPAAAVLEAPVGDSRGALAAARDRGRRAAAAAHARRRHRPQGLLRRPAVGRRGRPQPARAGPDEPGAELARGDAGRRRAGDHGRERGDARPGEPELARRAADRRRHRPRHGARGDRARLRAVLHHQGRVRPRRRPRAGDRLRDRHQRPRADRARVRAGRGHHRHRAAARGAAGGRRRPVHERAARPRRDRAGGRGRRCRAGVDRPAALRGRLPGGLGRVAARWRWSASTRPTCSSPTS